MEYFDRYPRSGPPHPDFFTALFPSMKYDGHAPASMEIVAAHEAEEPTFIYIMHIALLARRFDKDYLARARSSVYRYLLEDGRSAKVLETCRESIDVCLRLGETQIPTPVKRAGIDRVQEFERRLDAYRTSEAHSILTISAVNESLRRLGGAGAGAGAPSVSLLVSAILKLPDAGMRSECNARFEKLASQIWGWEYPILTDQWHERLMVDFRRTQVELVSKFGDQHAGCSNVTIRMLWHFDRVKFPYKSEMFRLPESADSWAKNLSRLGIQGTWDPRSRSSKKQDV